MKKTALSIRLHAQPGKRDEVKRIWEKYARDYLKDAKGLLAYFYCFDNNDPDVIVAFQVLAGSTGVDEFTRQPWYPAYQAETAEWLASPPEFSSLDPLWMKEVCG